MRSLAAHVAQYMNPDDYQPYSAGRLAALADIQANNLTLPQLKQSISHWGSLYQRHPYMRGYTDVMGACLNLQLLVRQ